MSDDAFEIDDMLDQVLTRRYGERYLRMKREDESRHRDWWLREAAELKRFGAIVLVVFVSFVLLTGCDAPINPVKFQPVEVLVTRPCLAGKNPPPPADTRIAVVCDGKTCTMTCSDTRPEECAKHMAADIAELQREARESRVLIKECSK